MIKIAVIGGGFSGLSVTANIIQLLRREKKSASLTMFEPKGRSGGRAFSPYLPDYFYLNHEANFMGIVNPFANGIVGYDDFYQWLQKNKNRKLPSLNGQTIATCYKKHDLNNPKAYLPRSLYGHYLMDRQQALLDHPRGKNYEFIYKQSAVTNLKKANNKFLVAFDNTEQTFDIVILCTGFWYSKFDNCGKIYSPHNDIHLSKSSSIGIIGSSLSSIEIALSLINKGYTDITMYSRHGRLPKVRGETVPYTPKYVTADSLEKLQNKFGLIKTSSLLPLLKAELDFAYEAKGVGLYQEKGINWKELILNTNPIEQLKKDIQACENGEELVWRSVLSSFYKFERLLWRDLHRKSREKLLSNHSSLMLSYMGPMPLPQAKRLLKAIENGTIKLVAHAKRQIDENGEAVIVLKDGTRVQKDYIIDARGPSKNVENNSFLTSLVDTGLLEKNPAGGIVVNQQLQVVSNNKVLHNMYALGPMVYGQRPHNSSVFTTDYAENIAAFIVNSIPHEEATIEFEDNPYDYGHYTTIAL